MITIDAVAVTTTNMVRTVEFYKLLGFEFGTFAQTDDHVEPMCKSGARLMIDKASLIQRITGHIPKPGNHSCFAIKAVSAESVNKICEDVKTAGFTIIKEPWDAFWGQRYAIVADPDGYKVDIFANL